MDAAQLKRVAAIQSIFDSLAVQPGFGVFNPVEFRIRAAKRYRVCSRSFSSIAARSISPSACFPALSSLLLPCVR